MPARGAGPRSRRRTVVAALLVVVTLGLVAAGIVWRASQPYHWGVVTPGVLYRSGLLAPDSLDAVIQEHEIRTVVSLLPRKGDRLEGEQRVTRERGVNLVEIQLPTRTVPSPEQIRQWLALFEEPDNLPVLVHCKQGRVRTGVMVALYEMEHLNRSNALARRDVDHELEDPKYRGLREFLRDYTPMDASPDS